MADGAAPGFSHTARQREAIMLLGGPARHILLYGGARCLSGDAILDGQTKTLAELAAAGNPVEVITSHGRQMAGAPFLKGCAELWRLDTADGRSVTVTDDHRFWSGDQWIKANEVRVGSVVAVRSSSPFLPASTLGPYPSAFPADGQRSSRRLLSSQGRYWRHRHQCDEQPLLAAIGDLASCASPGDVAERSRDYHQVSQPGSGSRTHLTALPVPARTLGDLLLSRPSKTGAWLGPRHSEPASDRGVEQTCGSSPSSRRAPQLSPGRSTQERSHKRAHRGPLSECVLSESQRACPSDTPSAGGYSLVPIVRITRAAKQPFYTIHVPGCEHFFANGILHHNSGKTFIACEAIAARAMEEPNSRHALLRFRFNHAKAAIWHDTWPKMMRLCYPDIPYNPNKSDYFYTLPAKNRRTGKTGWSEVWLGGLDDKERAEKVLGQEYATGLLSECSQIPLASRELFRTRIAQKTGLVPKLYYDENPPLSTHWTHRIFIEHRAPESPFDPLPDPEHYASLLMNPTHNRENLPPELLDELARLSPRARLRFFEGKFGDATEGALWTLENIEANRVGIGASGRKTPDTFLRIAVAVDPSGTKGDPDKGSDSIGIIVAALGLDGHGYVLEDVTVSAAPAVWGRVVVSAYERHRADIVVGEINFGGAMVEHTIKTAAKEAEIKVKYKEVHASRGKVVRAEPISALYEQCIAGGMTVETGRGAVPVERVVAGDLVWTREGLKPVLWSGQTGVRETVILRHDSGKLDCTYDHPIFCQRGVIQAGTIVPKADRLIGWLENTSASHAALRSGSQAGDADHAPPSSGGKRAKFIGTLWSEMASAISGKRMAIGAPQGIMVGSSSTALFGDPPMAQFQMEPTFITSLRTWTTTSPALLSRSPREIISALTTWASQWLMTPRPNSLPLNVGGGPRLSRDSAHANSAVRISGREQPESDFAPLPVTQPIGIGSVERGRVQPVYNLHVADCHEFFAGGVLVHNCKIHHVGTFSDLEDQMLSFTTHGYMGEKSPDRADALVWALTELFPGMTRAEKKGEVVIQSISSGYNPHTGRYL